MSFIYVPALCSNPFSVLYLTLHRSFTVCIEKDTMHFIRDNGITFQAKTGPSNAAFLVGETIPVEEFASLSSAATLPLDWTSGIVASAILTWQASRSCFQATW